MTDNDTFFIRNVLKICIRSMNTIGRAGTNFWLKIRNFFLENLFGILKKPFYVKRSSNSDLHVGKCI